MISGQAQRNYGIAVRRFNVFGLVAPNNIAEGHGRWHFQENMQFCRVSRGSVEETLDDLNLYLDEEYASPDFQSEFCQCARRR